MIARLRQPRRLLSGFRAKAGPAALCLALLLALPPRASAQGDSLARLGATSVQDGATSATIIPISLDIPFDSTQGPFSIDQDDARSFDIVPPLSVYESRLLLRQADAQLATESTPTLQSRLPRVDTMLSAVGRYIRWVDETHTTLPFYEWSELDDLKLRTENWRTFSLKPDRARKNVTAISLQSHHNDVAVEQVVIHDSEGRQWQFTQPIQVRGDQPRAEVLFLAVPIKLVQVDIRCRQTSDDTNDDRPRLFVQTGVSSRPESAKEAVYVIQRARYALRQGQFPDARRYIDHAEKLLVAYQKDRRL